MHPYTIIRLEAVDSTNNWAKAAFAAGKISMNSVILAETQTEGRGQMQTKWQDAPGCNLLFTLVLEPKNLLVDSFFFLNQAVSLALVTALPKELAPCIKWPNDVLVKTKKVAGVLIETVVRGNAITRAYIGIGLNVNQREFSPELWATSLLLETGAPVNRETLLFNILSHLHHHISQTNKRKMHEQYLAHLYSYQKKHLFLEGNRAFFAQVENVAPTGELLLRTEETNSTKAYRFKEVSWVLPNE